MGIFIEKILNYLSRICLKKELCKYNESSLLNFHQERTRSTYVYTGFQKKKKKVDKYCWTLFMFTPLSIAAAALSSRFKSNNRQPQRR